PVQPTANPPYLAVATHDCGSDTSEAITVTVVSSCTRPNIGTPSLSVTPADATLSVSATNATSVAWYVNNGLPVLGQIGTAPIATGTTVTLPRGSSDTSYIAAASNSCGAAASAPVTVPARANCPLLSALTSSAD